MKAKDKNFILNQVKSALLAIEGKISDPQMSMLRAHYHYRTLSMERIANFGGYSKYRAGNLQYGLLCRRLARQLKFEPPPPGEKTYTIATVSPEQDEKGHYQWRMDDVVAKALEEIEWVRPLSGEPPEASESPAEYEGIPETERQALIKARLGQGTFRTDVIALWGSCTITGCSLESILVASHIVSWKEATNPQRLDPFNGLLLTPNLDRLFDLRLISFKDDGSILLSKDLSVDTRVMLGVSKRNRLKFVRPAMKPYLRRHRELFLEREHREK